MVVRSKLPRALEIPPVQTNSSPALDAATKHLLNVQHGLEEWSGLSGEEFAPDTSASASCRQSRSEVSERYFAKESFGGSRASKERPQLPACDDDSTEYSKKKISGLGIINPKDYKNMRQRKAIPLRNHPKGNRSRLTNSFRKDGQASAGYRNPLTAAVSPPRRHLRQFAGTLRRGDRCIRREFHLLLSCVGCSTGLARIIASSQFRTPHFLVFFGLL